MRKLACVNLCYSVQEVRFLLYLSKINQRRYFLLKKIIIALSIILIIFNSCVYAEEVKEVRFIPPKLPSDAEEYDPTKPENLKPNQLYAKSAILIEAGTGQVVFEKNADDTMFPASTTKILTVLLGLQNGNLDDTVYLSETAADVSDDSSRIPLEVGESINFRDLLYATMLRSGNEGANLIAETISGDMSSFVQLMNQTAQNLGCTSTKFTNPNGLHDDNHYTTARDMAIIAREAMKNEEFVKIVEAKSYTLPASNINKRRKLTSRISEFIVPGEKNDFYYPYGNGIKTGFTNSAGHCFVGSAESLGVKLISVVFYTTQNGRWTDTKKLMDYGFSQISSMSPQEIYSVDPIVLETSGYSLKDENLGKLELELVSESGQTNMMVVTTKKNIDSIAEDMHKYSLISYSRDFRAPISKGEKLGTLSYINPQTNEMATYALVAKREIAARESAPLSLSQIEEQTYADPNFFPNISIELFVYWLIPPIILYIIITVISKIISSYKRNKTVKIKNKSRRY